MIFIKYNGRVTLPPLNYDTHVIAGDIIKVLKSVMVDNFFPIVFIV